MGVGFGFEPGVPPEVTIKRMLGVTPAEAAVEPVEATEAVEPAKPVKRRRARHPAGAEPEKPGTFVADDPATEVNEAWVEE
jgi:hypothetical protein